MNTITEDQILLSLPEDWVRPVIKWLGHADIPNKELLTRSLEDLLRIRGHMGDTLRHHIRRLEDCLEGASVSIETRRQLERIISNMRQDLRVITQE